MRAPRPWTEFHTSAINLKQAQLVNLLVFCLSVANVLADDRFIAFNRRGEVPSCPEVLTNEIYAHTHSTSRPFFRPPSPIGHLGTALQYAGGGA